MNKAKDLSLTLLFVLASLVAFSATHNEAGDGNETDPTPKYKASSILSLNLFDLFMLRPVKQDTTAVLPKEEDLAPLVEE